MRRRDREIVDINKIENIISKARYMHLGMFNEKYPYVVPLHYGYQIQDGKLIFYVHSAREGLKLECLKKNDHVFVQIDCGEQLIAADVPCGYGAEYESVMCQGKASIIENPDEKCKALTILMKTQTKKEHIINEQMISGVTVIRIDIESYSAKRCIR